MKGERKKKMISALCAMIVLVVVVLFFFKESLFVSHVSVTHKRINCENAFRHHIKFNDSLKYCDIFVDMTFSMIIVTNK